MRSGPLTGGTHVSNRLIDGTVHGAVVQAGCVDIVMQAPAAAATPVTVSPPLGLRDAGRPLRGREDILVRLEAELAASKERVLVLCGMGGCGKTAVALEIAARRSAAGCRVWWVDARNGPALEAALRAVARQAGANAGELDRGDTADLLWSHLTRMDAPWLLVVDNADDPTLLDGPGALNAGTGWIRPAAGRGAVLVTSRDSTPDTWGPAARVHLLQPLTGDRLDDAARVLRDHAPDGAGTEAEAQALAARLGGLPLALRLAGTYLAQANRTPPPFRARGTLTTYTEYQRAWEEGLELPEPGHALARAWTMSVDLLQQRGHTRARPLLRLIASFADADLPYTHLLTPDRLADAGALAALDGPTVWQHLTALAALGLVDLPEPVPGTPPVLRMHPLVRDASRTPDTVTAATGILTAAALADETGEPEEPEHWAVWRLLAPHILDAFHRAEISDVTETALLGLAGSVDRAARHLHVEGLQNQARTEFEALLAIQRERWGDSHASTVTTRHHFALLLLDQGEPEAARAELEAVLAIKREQYGNTHLHTLSTRHELARALQRQGELEAARTEFEAILAVPEGRLHDTLATRHSLATVLCEQGDLVVARTEFEEILAIQRSQLGDTHPDTLNTRHSLARVLLARGELEAALGEFEAVHATMRAQLGDTHPNTLTARHNVAVTLFDHGDTATALAELKTVLAIRRSQLGATHPNILTLRKHLARTLLDHGEAEAARMEYEEILAIQRNLLGDTHPDTLNTRHSLARVLLARGELEAALGQFEAVHATMRAQLGDTHPDTLTARHNVAVAMFDHGDAEAAFAELKAVLALQRSRLSDTHSATIAMHRNLAMKLFDHGDAEAAFGELKAVLALQRSQLGDTHPDTLATRHSLACALFDHGEAEAARVELEAVLAIRRAHLGDAHSATLTTRHNLARVLLGQGKQAAAFAELRAALAARRSRLGDTHPDTLALRHHLARTLFDHGEAESAHTELEAVLAIRRSQLGDTAAKWAVADG
ncbi:tetratricopeptide repeat protein [Kitasatospora sp. NPDC005856]|uniref:tetratricopeptide repeat protein n=1 Tax=Kitasatospora sp. NPDC005856 TaxID=3154566 RepID=UPI0033DB0CE6